MSLRTSHHYLSICSKLHDERQGVIRRGCPQFCRGDGVLMIAGGYCSVAVRTVAAGRVRSAARIEGDVGRMVVRCAAPTAAVSRIAWNGHYGPAVLSTQARNR